MSRTLTPAHFVETVDGSTRTDALLSAWAIRRASQGGWADRRHERGRALAKEEDELVDHVVGIGATIGLLGCARADAFFELWAPINRDAREVARGWGVGIDCHRRCVSLTSVDDYKPLVTRSVRVFGCQRRHNSERACTCSARVVFASYACSFHTRVVSLYATISGN